MKGYPVLFLLMFAVHGIMPSSVQAQGWQWARRSYTAPDYYISSWNQSTFTGPCTSDKFGNLIVTATLTNEGYFKIGSATVYNHAVYNQLVLAKLDFAGNVIFATGSLYSAAAPLSLASSNSGSIYLAGNYWGDSLKIGGGTVFNPERGLMCFLAKFDQVGNTIWIKNTLPWVGLSPPGYDFGRVDVDQDGNVFVTGVYNQKVVVIGADTLMNPDTTEATANIYVAKYDSLGNVIWAQSVGGNRSDVPWALTVAKSGDVYIAGNFNSKKFVVGADTIYNPYEDTVVYSYLIKVNSNGDPVWEKCFSQEHGSSIVSRLDTDPNDNIYMVGTYRQWFFMGVDTLISSNAGNLFLAKFDPFGNTKWIKTAEGGSRSFGNDVTVDNCGNIFVSGMMDGPDPIDIDGHIFGPTDGFQMYVISYDTNANYFKSMLFLNGGLHSRIVSDNGGGLYVYGNYGDMSMNFGIFTLAPDTSRGHSAWQAYMAKYSYDSFECQHYSFNSVEYVDLATENFLFYPNPTSNVLHIVCREKLASVLITDVLGKAVYTKICDQKEESIDVANLSTGIYFVRINGVAVKRFVKE